MQGLRCRPTTPRTSYQLQGAAHSWPAAVVVSAILAIGSFVAISWPGSEEEAKKLGLDVGWSSPYIYRNVKANVQLYDNLAWTGNWECLHEIVEQFKDDMLVKNVGRLVPDMSAADSKEVLSLNRIVRWCFEIDDKTAAIEIEVSARHAKVHCVTIGTQEGLDGLEWRCHTGLFGRPVQLLTRPCRWTSIARPASSACEQGTSKRTGRRVVRFNPCHCGID